MLSGGKCENSTYTSETGNHRVNRTNKYNCLFSECSLLPYFYREHSCLAPWQQNADLVILWGLKALPRSWPKPDMTTDLFNHNIMTSNLPYLVTSFIWFWVTVACLFYTQTLFNLPWNNPDSHTLLPFRRQIWGLSSHFLVWLPIK